MSLRRSFVAWTRIPIYDFQSGSLFWRSTHRCMDHYYYGRQNRTHPKKLPRSLLEQTPEDVVTSKKRRESYCWGYIKAHSYVIGYIDYTSYRAQGGGFGRRYGGYGVGEHGGTRKRNVGHVRGSSRETARATGIAFCSFGQPLKHTS
jgi:hypothetical protein